MVVVSLFFGVSDNINIFFKIIICKLELDFFNFWKMSDLVFVVENK